MVIVWLEGGQGEVRGAYAPPPNTPNRPTWTPPATTTTPHCPTWTPLPTDPPGGPPPKPLLDPPPPFALPDPPPKGPPANS